MKAFTELQNKAVLNVLMISYKKELKYLNDY